MGEAYLIKDEPPRLSLEQRDLHQVVHTYWDQLGQWDQQSRGGHTKEHTTELIGTYSQTTEWNRSSALTLGPYFGECIGLTTELTPQATVGLLLLLDLTLSSSASSSASSSRRRDQLGPRFHYYIKYQKFRTLIFRTFKFRTKIEYYISKITDAELILKFVKIAFTFEKLILVSFAYHQDVGVS